MGKKIPLLISTFIAAAGGLCWQSSPASAKYINTATNESVWTLDELIALEKETDAYLFNQCGDNMDCQREHYYALMESDSMHGALSSYQMYLFIITSINPAENTIKVFYQNRDEMTRWFGINADDNLLTELRIGWSNYADTPLIVQKEGYIPTNPALLPEDFHFAYSADETTHGRGWFPAREEVEIHTVDDLSLNSRGIMQFTMMSVYTNASGGFNYSSCLNSPYYQHGMECRAVYGDRSSLMYLPYQNGILADPNYQIVKVEQDPVEEPDNPNLEVMPTIPDEYIPSGNNQTDIIDETDNVVASDYDQNDSSVTVPRQETTDEISESKKPDSKEDSTVNTLIGYYTHPVYLSVTSQTKKSNPAVTDKSTNSSSASSENNQRQQDEAKNDNKNIKEFLTNEEVRQEVPLSGSNANGRNKEFPWWIFALLLSGVCVIIWWFIIPPKNKKKEE